MIKRYSNTAVMGDFPIQLHRRDLRHYREVQHSIGVHITPSEVFIVHNESHSGSGGLQDAQRAWNGIASLCKVTDSGSFTSHPPSDGENYVHSANIRIDIPELVNSMNFYKEYLHDPIRVFGEDFRYLVREKYAPKSQRGKKSKRGRFKLTLPTSSDMWGGYLAEYYESPPHSYTGEGAGHTFSRKAE